MEEKYLSDNEYENYYEKLENLRGRIARHLSIKPGMQILDLCTGYAYFAIEIASLDKKLKVFGIDISQKCVAVARKNIKRLKFDSNVQVFEMDATEMDFRDNEFDLVANFTGLEDIHMTRGKEGVVKTFNEVYRVLKPGNHFSFVVMLSEKAETEAQELEIALFSYICDATWLTGKEYEDMAVRAGFRIIGSKDYHTGKKLTPTQARQEIQYAVINVPKIYNKSVPSFEEIWEKFGNKIEKYGLGHYSKVAQIIAKK